MATYLALLRKDPDSDFGVDFPDFPGCITAGSTLEEARRMAVEALGGHVELMIEDGEAIPEPSSLDEIMADPDNHEAICFAVDVPVERSRLVRVNITLPEDLLLQIGMASNNRSRFLTDAAWEKLQGGSSRSAMGFREPPMKVGFTRDAATGELKAGTAGKSRSEKSAAKRRPR